MSDPTNEERAARIDVTLDAYRVAQNGRPMPADEGDVRDLLTDIMHWCRQNDVDFDAELSVATDNFSEEVNGYLISTDPEAAGVIEAFINDRKVGDLYRHENVTTFFEHGQWWASCGACGASWSIVDCNEDELDLEEVAAGDESCQVPE
jgi:hypothetical protein